MYHDLREVFWWDVLKRDVVEFFAKCPNFLQVTAEHQKLSVLLKEIQIPTWEWEDSNMNFVVGLPRTRMQYDYIWV